jgi:hypothetical protein
MQYHIVSHNNSRGFIRFIIFIIIIAVLLSIFGINPLTLWTDVIVPILTVIWESLLAIITFTLGILESIINTVSN